LSVKGRVGTERHLTAEFWHPSRVRIISLLLTGGLRCAPTTGYYLTALQAVESSDIGRRANLFQDFPDLLVMAMLVVTDKGDRSNTIDVA